MLLVGYGKLAQMILSLNQEQKTFYIYNRTADKVKKAASFDKRIQYCNPESFSKFRYVFLALPSEACVSFIKQYASLFPKGSVFFLPATSLSTDELKREAPDHHIVPSKFAGHAQQAKRDKQPGMFVVPTSFEEERDMLKKWLGPVFNVVDGTEEMVETANRVAVEETMKLIVALENRLSDAKVSPAVQDVVLAQIPAGVIRAHLEGTHGAFAKKVLKQLEMNKGDKG